ncbi:interleukin-31 receptor subunit alpha [Salarias fasciatus]|nr:interleukin-31 receptor subunit alpha-like [Salarias fasciatus]
MRQRSRNYCSFYPNIEGSLKSVNFTVYEKLDMNVEVFEHGEAANCTKAVFQGSPKDTLRCGPPQTASFSRTAGRLQARVSWLQDDMKVVDRYNMRYKTLGSRAWSESFVRSENGSSCRVDTLNSSLVYSVQIQCVPNDKCSQCPWSEAYTVPAALTTPPIVQFHEKDHARKKGRRVISVAWTPPDRGQYDGYRVTVWKASGETRGEQTITAQPHLRLVLSYSSYRLNVSAVNNASVSPAASVLIPRSEDQTGVPDGRLNVTVHHNNSFTVFWKDNLSRSYVCYSVEWWEKEQKTIYMSFHESKNNYRTLFPLPEPLKPYTRYNITLHTRPNKDTCNMVRVNNSESTYASTQFYSVEGSPVGAPTNISTSDITLDSAVLRWSCIPEEGIRGFLTDYTIYFMEYHQREASAERNVTVGPTLNSFELAGLKSDTVYQVQMSGSTSAGEGVRSATSFFKTKPKEKVDLGLIVGFVVVALVLICGSPVIKRVKVILWPSIPNPGRSNAMQKIDGADELELTEAISILNVDEWDVKSLHILEREAASPANVLTLLNPPEDEEDSAGSRSSWAEDDTDSAGRDVSLSDPNTLLHTQQTNMQGSALAFAGGYTTVEMFQQGMNAAATPDVGKSSPDLDSTTMRPGLDYVRQVSYSPASGGERTSTFL